MFDLLSNFRIQYLAGIVLLLMLAIPCRLFVAAAVLLMILCVHAWDVGQLYRSHGQAPSASVSVLRLMTTNLLASNTEFESQVENIRTVGPDVVVLQEYSHRWEQVLSVSLSEYPHRISESIDSPFGIAIYSKTPFLKSEVFYLHDKAPPSIAVVVDTPAGQVQIIGVHLEPPIGVALFDRRNTQLQRLAQLVKTASEPVIVAGDLNISPWSVHFQDLLHDGSLRDGRRGFGVLPTWPGFFFPLQIPIDHILIGGSMSVTDIQTGLARGSDHLSLWADVVINAQR